VGELRKILDVISDGYKESEWKNSSGEGKENLLEKENEQLKLQV